MWRAMLAGLHFDEHRFARSFESFKEFPQTLNIGEFDSSLEGIGVLIYDESHNSLPANGYRGIIIGGGAISLLPLSFTDNSSYQNTAEFIGAIFVIIVMRRLGHLDIKVKLRGDSITALTWAVEERFRSDLIHNAAIVFILILIITKSEIVGMDHISSENNWRCDGLSRPSLMKTHDDLGLTGIKFIDLENDPIATEIVRLCDPKLSIESDEEFRQFWQRAREAISCL
jgi:hypothetical protein